MSSVVIVARDNAYGLTQESGIIRRALEAAGHRVTAATPHARSLADWWHCRRVADIVVHLERVAPRWLNAGRINLLEPNQERYPRRLVFRLRRLDAVLSKTVHATEIFTALGVATRQIGFTSRDRFDPSVRRDWTRFFHLAGGSTLKGTEPILALWRRHPEWPQLVLVQKAANAPAQVPANVRLERGYIDDATLRQLQNACGIHLCPSRSEGWGHHLVEGLSVGAVVVTTDAPPMNEHVRPGAGILVPWSSQSARHVGTNYFVDEAALEREITALLTMPEADKMAIGSQARRRFEEIDGGFARRIVEVFNDLSDELGDDLD